MFAAARLHRAQNRANGDAAESDKGDHYDEPSDADGLGDHHTAARFWRLLFVNIASVAGR